MLRMNHIVNSQMYTYSSYNLKIVEEDIIPSIINGKGTKEFIATSITHTDNDTIEQELHNSKSASQHKIIFKLACYKGEVP